MPFTRNEKLQRLLPDVVFTMNILSLYCLGIDAPGDEYRSSSTIRQTTILFPHLVYGVTKWSRGTIPFFITILCSDSLLVYVADKYVNDQIHLYYDPSSFSLPLYTALKYATGLL